jgi:hypothetical protein
MLHWFAKRREGDVKIIGGVGGGSLSDPCYGFQMFISDPLPLLFQKSKPEQEPLLFKSRNWNRKKYLRFHNTAYFRSVSDLLFLLL